MCRDKELTLCPHKIIHHTDGDTGSTGTVRWESGCSAHGWSWMHEADVGRAGSVYPGGRVTTVLGAWLGNLWKPQFEGKSYVYGQETHSEHPRPQDSDA